MAISSNLKAARLEANLSQPELAEKLEISPRTYGSYERGERDVSTALLLKICTVLHISSDTLLGIRQTEEKEKTAPGKIPEDGLYQHLKSLTSEELKDLNTFVDYLYYKRSHSHDG